MGNVKSLNIAVVVGVFPTVSETFIVNQITSLIDKGHSVYIYSYQKTTPQKLHKSIIRYNLLDKVVYREKPPNGKVNKLRSFLLIMIKNFSNINWKLLFKTLNYSKYGKKAINLKTFYNRKFFVLHKKFDVVHVHFANNAQSIAKYKREGFLQDAKLVVSFHGYDINPSKIEAYKLQYRMLFEEANHFTVNTIYTKEILDKVNSSLTNVSILPVGLDSSLFRKKESKLKSLGGFKLVYCGRLVPFKGAMLLPTIIKELISRGFDDISLKIIGSGELKTQLDKEIDRLELSNTVEILGAMTQEDVIDVFNDSNAFILPGIYNKVDGRAENQGLVIQEAQAMELPVIVSDVGGMKYGLVPNKTGFVVKENDIKAFADCIELLIKNPEKAKKMGKEGRDFVIRNYNSNNLVDELISIYRG